MDYYIFQQINNLAGHWAWLDAAGVFLASYFQYFLGAWLVVYLLLGRDKDGRKRNLKITIWGFASAIVARFGFGEIIKRLVARPRPFEIHRVTQLISEDLHLSFPSGHVTFFFGLAMFIYFYNKKAGWVMFVGGFLIGLARIYVGVHYPLDILGGMVLGILVGWWMYRLSKRYIKK